MIPASFLACLAIAGPAVAIAPVVGARSSRPRSRIAIAAAALHPTAMLCLFYSLAIHMHRRLDGWPRTIGDQGFPEALVVHADFAQLAFGSLLLGCLFVLPLAVALCLCVPRMRGGLYYLGIYALVGLASFGATLLAPEPFLNWWWD